MARWTGLATLALLPGAAALVAWIVGDEDASEVPGAGPPRVLPPPEIDACTSRVAVIEAAGPSGGPGTLAAGRA